MNGDRLAVPFIDEDTARKEILQTARTAGLSADLLHVVTLHGGRGNLMNSVDIYFPEGSAQGTYDEILAAIRSSSSYGDLARICQERNLTPQP